MSLTSFVGMREVREKIEPFRSTLPRKITVPVIVTPKSDRYSTVGTAFDYLLRFELQRQAPHAVTKEWIAELGLDCLRPQKSGKATVWGPLRNPYPDQPEKVLERATKSMDNAKAAVAAYLKTTTPNRIEQADLAAHAIRLAKLDPVYRAFRLEPTFDVADPEDVEDLLNLLAIVPFDKLLHAKVLLLNPNFGATSELVGAADTDLITGDMLVDLKTTKNSKMTADNLDQLFGYYLLARRHRQVDPTFPEIKRLALYFCRHGHLWIVDARTWTDHPQFSDIEKWFFQRAEKIYGRPRKSGRSVRKPSV